MTSAQSDGQHRSTGDLRAIFDAVRPGLQRVEVKLKTVDSSLFAPLANAFVNLIGSGGKRLRPALALMSAELNGSLADTPAYDRVIALAAAVEMLHTSTLVHDDVIDGALLRRGAPTLNALWSGGATVLAGNYMFGTAAQFAAETGNMRVIHLFSDTLNVIVEGELRQLRARHWFDQPKDEYYQRIYAKTASLFCAATEGAAILSGLPEAAIVQLRDYGYNLGMAFQIVDDMLDFIGSEESLGKPAGSDLRQGTLTLPFFYYLRNHPNPQPVIDHLTDRYEQSDEENPQPWYEAVAAVVADLRHSSAIVEAGGEAQRFLNNARTNLAAFADNLYSRSMLALCNFVLERTY
jgi:geranylgeranyl pyrophosphate synthase